MIALIVPLFWILASTLTDHSPALVVLGAIAAWAALYGVIDSIFPQLRSKFLVLLTIGTFSIVALYFLCSRTENNQTVNLTRPPLAKKQACDKVLDFLEKNHGDVTNPRLTWVRKKYLVWGDWVFKIISDSGQRFHGTVGVGGIVIIPDAHSGVLDS